MAVKMDGPPNFGSEAAFISFAAVSHLTLQTGGCDLAWPVALALLFVRFVMVYGSGLRPGHKPEAPSVRNEFAGESDLLRGRGA
jgi:hypothetical protein